jgi:hypothetical protein
MQIIIGDGPGNMPLGQCMQEAADAEREFSMTPARLSAELTVDGAVVKVPSVPAPEPATQGHITVKIPYPHGPSGWLTFAAVANEDLGVTLRQGIVRTWIEPGDSVQIQFGEESIDWAQVMKVFGEMP